VRVSPGLSGVGQAEIDMFVRHGGLFKLTQVQLLQVAPPLALLTNFSLELFFVDLKSNEENKVRIHMHSKVQDLSLNTTLCLVVEMQKSS
jgi:hypothetical protein